MKKICLILVVLLCITAVFGSFAAFADTTIGNVLTLAEAKELALKNDVQYALQDSYIQDAQENYKEISDDSSNTTAKSNIAERATAYISQKVQLENAYYSVQKAVLKKEDIKRTSDYEVTDYFYAVIEAQNSVVDSKIDMEQKKESMNTAQFKYGLNILTKDSLNQTEAALAASQAEYNKAALELEKCILLLGKSIGEELDLSSIKLDTSINIPDIAGIVLGDIKEDNIKNNPTYFNSKGQYKLAEYELQLTEEKHDYYFDNLNSISSTVEEALDDMLYDAQKTFDDAEYIYNEKLEALDEAIKDQQDNLIDLYEIYEDEKEDLEDSKLEVTEKRIKLQLGLITDSELEDSLASLSELEHKLYSTKASIVRQYMDFTQYSDEE